MSSQREQVTSEINLLMEQLSCDTHPLQEYSQKKQRLESLLRTLEKMNDNLRNSGQLLEG